MRCGNGLLARRGMAASLPRLGEGHPPCLPRWRSGSAGGSRVHASSQAARGDRRGGLRRPLLRGEGVRSSLGGGHLHAHARH